MGGGGGYAEDVFVAKNKNNGSDSFQRPITVASGEYGTFGSSIAVGEYQSNTIAHVAWTNANNEVKYSRDVGLSGTYEPPQLLSQPITGDPDTGDNWGVSIAADNNGNVYAVWHSRIDSNYEEDIYIARSQNGGESGSWGLPKLVNGDWGSFGYERTWRDLFPSIVVDSSGNLHLTFSWGGEIMYTKSEDNGQTWPYLVSAQGGAPYPNYGFPSIATLDGTNIYISWTYGGYVYCVSSYDGGVSWDALSAINPVPALTYNGFTSVAVNQAGDVYVVNNNDHNLDVYKRLSGETTWSTSNPYSISDTFDPNVATDIDGNAAIMWLDYSADTVNFIRN